jgi:hypothetical protein
VSRNAAAIGLVALAAGLLAQFLFVEAGFGINVLIATVALLLAGWLVRDRATPPPRPIDSWLAPGALILAAFVALRGDVTLVTLDLLGAIALSGAALASFRGLRVLERPLGALAQLAGRVAASATVAGARPFAALGRALPSARGRARTGRVAPVVRGLAIAAPLVLVFVALFSSADAVFARITGDLFDWNLDLGSLLERLLLAAFVAWVAAGLLWFVVQGEDPSPEAAGEVPGVRPGIGSAEALTVLVVLDLLFIGFVALQAAYLFGGHDTLEASGITYAEYARRGFFELLAVAFLVAGLIVVLEGLVRTRTRAYVGAAIALVLLTIVVLASAFLRLRLYQDAYGWTELRFYVLAAIAWLAIGAVIAVLTLARNQTRWLIHGMLLISFVFGIAFNLIGPVRFIAEQNIERAVNPKLIAPGGETGLDVYYLAILGDDALTVLAENLCALPAPQSRQALETVKMWQGWIRRDEAGKAWQAWNLSRERARDRQLPSVCPLSTR